MVKMNESFRQKMLGRKKSLTRKGVVIDTEAALYHVDRVRALHTRTLADAALVLGSGVWYEGWRKMARGPRALVGRIDLHHKIRECAPRARLIHRHPEDGLHPKFCCELGDLFIRWTKEADLPPGLAAGT